MLIKKYAKLLLCVIWFTTNQPTNRIALRKNAILPL